MRILIVNKYLYRSGGAETYVLKLGEYLSGMGNEVEYFGMADERNEAGNRVGAYSENIDFHSQSLKKLTYPFKIIYSFKTASALRRVIDDFKPDAALLNNFNYQLTPSVIYELKKHNIPIVYTAHDSQLVCPSHRMKNSAVQGLCRECGEGRYYRCIKNRCIHSSLIRSILGTAEAYLYRILHTYRLIDRVICPSRFMEKELLRNTDLTGKTVVMHNFIEKFSPSEAERENYVLYFGRYSEEKGIRTLIRAAQNLPSIQFVFAGGGDLEEEINGVDNIRNLGFLTGKELQEVIEKAAFSVLPAEWAENCPFTVMESQSLMTPVIGADIGGIPELIDNGRTGLLFESGNSDELTEKIEYLYKNRELCRQMSAECASVCYDTISEYSERILNLFEGLIK